MHKAVRFLSLVVFFVSFSQTYCMQALRSALSRSRAKKTSVQLVHARIQLQKPRFVSLKVNKKNPRDIVSSQVLAWMPDHVLAPWIDYESANAAKALEQINTHVPQRYSPFSIYWAAERTAWALTNLKYEKRAYRKSVGHLNAAIQSEKHMAIQALTQHISDTNSVSYSAYEMYLAAKKAACALQVLKLEREKNKQPNSKL